MVLITKFTGSKVSDSVSKLSTQVHVQHYGFFTLTSATPKFVTVLESWLEIHRTPISVLFKFIGTVVDTVCVSVSMNEALENYPRILLTSFF